MTFEDLKPYIEKLGSSEKLCIYSNSNDGLLDTIFIHPKNGKPYEYVNIFLTKEINEDPDIFYFFKEINKEDCYFLIQTTTEWCLYKRKENYDKYMRALEDEQPNNAKLILNEVKRDQGKYVVFDFGNGRDKRFEGFLISVAASDEDYYYVYLKEDKTIGMMTCVSGYHLVDNEEHTCGLTDREIFKLLHKTFEEGENIDALIYLGIYNI